MTRVCKFTIGSSTKEESAEYDAHTQMLDSITDWDKLKSAENDAGV